MRPPPYPRAPGALIHLITCMTVILVCMIELIDADIDGLVCDVDDDSDRDTGDVPALSSL